MLEIVIWPSFSIFKYYNFVRVCSSDLFYFTCVMHVTLFLHRVSLCSIPRRSRRRRWRWNVQRGNVQRGIVTKPAIPVVTQSDVMIIYAYTFVSLYVIGILWMFVLFVYS